jgi:hypothetical protein
MLFYGKIFYKKKLFLENRSKHGLHPEPEPKLLKKSEPEPQQIITVPEH